MKHSMYHPRVHMTQIVSTTGGSLCVPSFGETPVSSGLRLREDPWTHPAWQEPGKVVVQSARGRRARFAQRYGLGA